MSSAFIYVVSTIRSRADVAFEEDGFAFWGRRMVIGLGFRSVGGVGMEKKKSG